MVTRRTVLTAIALAGTRVLPVNAEQKAGHVVLIGDSIFDNGAYVGSDPEVVERLKSALPPQWKATLIAIDGATTGTVTQQLAALPDDTSHIVISVGGNDALSHKGLLGEKATSVAEVLTRLAKIQKSFRQEYQSMLDQALAFGLPAAVCTIYNSRYPDLAERDMANVGLTIFNDVITEEAASRGIPVIDLRAIFRSDEDYANPVEPSSQGGKKIAIAIVRFVAPK